MQLSGSQARGSHQICQEICDPWPLALNGPPLKAAAKPVGAQGMW